MNDSDPTPEAVEAMALDLLRAGHADAADMLRRLLARALAAEGYRNEGSAPSSSVSDASIIEQEAGVGESLEEIVRGEHQGP